MRSLRAPKQQFKHHMPCAVGQCANQDMHGIPQLDPHDEDDDDDDHGADDDDDTHQTNSTKPPKSYPRPACLSFTKSPLKTKHNASALPPKCSVNYGARPYYYYYCYYYYYY